MGSPIRGTSGCYYRGGGGGGCQVFILLEPRKRCESVENQCILTSSIEGNTPVFGTGNFTPRLSERIVSRPILQASPTNKASESRRRWGTLKSRNTGPPPFNELSPPVIVKPASVTSRGSWLIPKLILNTRDPSPLLTFGVGSFPDGVNGNALPFGVDLDRFGDTEFAVGEGDCVFASR